MVDPITGSGALQATSAIRGTQSNLDKQKSEQASGTSTLQDEVKISEEALSQQQAEAAASGVRERLEESGYSLGLDPDFDTTA